MVWVFGRIDVRYLLETLRTLASGIHVANRSNDRRDFSSSNWGSCMRFCQVGAETDFFRHPNQTPMTSFVSCVAQKCEYLSRTAENLRCLPNVQVV